MKSMINYFIGNVVGLNKNIDFYIVVPYEERSFYYLIYE